MLKRLFPIILFLLPFLVRAQDPQGIIIGDIFLLPDSSLYTSITEAENPFEEQNFTLSITNNSDSTRNLYASTIEPSMLARNWKIIQNGKKKIQNSSSYLFEFQLNPKSTAQLYFTLNELQLHTEKGFQFQIVDTETYDKENGDLEKYQFFVLGIMLFLFAFNVILYIVTKWKVYGWYSLYIISACIYIAYYFGFFQNLGDSPVYLSTNVAMTLYATIFVFYFWFMLHLGNYKESNPKAALFLKIGIGYQVIQIFMELIFYAIEFNFHQSVTYKYFFLVFELALMLMIIFQIGRHPDFRGKIVIGGSSFLILAAILAQFNTGLNPILILEIGILLELLAFSAGLGYISRRYYVERNRNQELYLQEVEKNRKIQEKMQKDLEATVEERTQHLKEAKEFLEEKNKENLLLMGEVHHRVKNNLQMISSMLRMQYRRLEDQESQKALADALQRINTIGLLHQHLYNEKNQMRVDLKDYVQELWKNILDGYSDQQWTSQIECESIELEMDAAFKVGIILNELIINAFKYSVNHQESKLLKIYIGRLNGSIKVEVIDNGKKQHENFEEGFGYKIIRVLASSPDNVKIHSGPNVYSVEVSLPVN